ncbi:hypothetical protein [Arenibaculum pallidiluteum]|uniref:hypothetical protein n=1 Tax=Arenibaculum pallidiluteum TaxID=2812559 RepID=UPI001A975F7A|nr:hypothetical protein [Arenibaculum pallidiluteum]
MAPQLFLGMPKQTLLSCAGVPDRSANIDNLEFYTYTSRRTAAYPSTTTGFYGSRYAPYYGYGLGYAAPLAYDVVDVSCDATFTLRNGAVERLIYGGDAAGGTSRLGQCYAIVENCLALAQQQPRIQEPALTTPAPQQAPATPRP